MCLKGAARRDVRARSLSPTGTLVLAQLWRSLPLAPLEGFDLLGTAALLVEDGFRGPHAALLAAGLEECRARGILVVTERGELVYSPLPGAGRRGRPISEESRKRIERRERAKAAQLQIEPDRPPGQSPPLSAPLVRPGQSAPDNRADIAADCPPPPRASENPDPEDGRKEGIENFPSVHPSSDPDSGARAREDNADDDATPDNRADDATVCPPPPRRADGVRPLPRHLAVAQMLTQRSKGRLDGGLTGPAVAGFAELLEQLAAQGKTEAHFQRLADCAASGYLATKYHSAPALQAMMGRRDAKTGQYEATGLNAALHYSEAWHATRAAREQERAAVHAPKSYGPAPGKGPALTLDQFRASVGDGFKLPPKVAGDGA